MSICKNDQNNPDYYSITSTPSLSQAVGASTTAVKTTNTTLGSSQLHSGIHAMEESLRCVVCRDFFRNPISLYPCQHSFCSECVRKSLKEQLKSLKRTANCPVCRTQLDTTGIAFEKCIRPNPTLEELSKVYTSIRKELYMVLSSSPTTTISSSLSSRSRLTESIQQNESSAIPISQQQQQQQRKLIKKNPVYYTSLKKKQLQELCRKEGLATHGSEMELKQRHQAFVELYNAECDSSTPRTHAELLQDFAHREQQRRVVESQDRRNGAHQHAAYVDRVFQQRNGVLSLSSTMRSKDPEFEQEWKEGWKRLIALGKRQLEEERIRKTKDDSTVIHNGTVLVSNSAPETRPNDVMKNVEALYKNEEEVNDDLKTPIKNISSDMTRNETTYTTDMCMTTVERENRENQDYNMESNGHCKVTATTASTTPRVTKRQFELDISCPWSSSTSLSDASRTISEPEQSNHMDQLFLPTKRSKATYQVSDTQRTSSRSIVGPWTCRRCTFVNTTRTWSKAKCEMCELPRQSSSQTHELITLK